MEATIDSGRIVDLSKSKTQPNSLIGVTLLLSPYLLAEKVGAAKRNPRLP